MALGAIRMASRPTTCCISTQHAAKYVQLESTEFHEGLFHNRGDHIAHSCLFALAAGALADAKWLGMSWACGAIALVALGAAMLSYLNAKPTLE